MEKQLNFNESLNPRGLKFLETSLSVKPFSDASNIKVKLTLWSVLHVTNVAVKSNGLQLIGDVNFSSKNEADIQLKLVGEKGDIRFTLTLSDASTMELSLFAVKGEKYIYVAEDSYGRAVDLQKINELSQVDYLRYKYPKIFAQQTQTIPPVSTRNLKTKQIFHLHGRIKWEDFLGKTHDLMGCRFGLMTTIYPYKLDIVDKNGNALNGSFYTDIYGRYDLYIKAYPDTQIVMMVLPEIKNASVTQYKNGNGYSVPIFVRMAKDISDVDNNFIIPDTYKNEERITAIPAGYTYLNIETGNAATAAMQITQALYLGFKYVEQMDRDKKFKHTTVYFPRNINVNDGDGSHCKKYDIFLADTAYKSWDIILHEFGHVIQNQYDIKKSTNGLDHNAKLDDIETYGKDKGTILAWAESWPTVLAIRITQYFLNIYNLQDYPYIADDMYNANNVGNNPYEWWDDDLEKTHYNLFGEGCELNIMGALYDMIDKSGKKPNGKLPLTDKEFWDLLMDSKAKTFSQFITFAYKKFGTSDKTLANILMTHGFAPRDIKYESDKISYTLPGNKDCSNSLHNESHVDLFASLQSSKPLSSVKINTKTQSNQVSYRLPMLRLYIANLRYFYARIYSYQTNSPKTGPYYSETMRFEIPRLYGGIYTIFPSDFQFLTNRKQHSRTTSIANRNFTFEGFNMLYQDSKVLVNDPDNVGYSKLIIKTTNAMINNVVFFLTISKLNQYIYINPNNKIEVSYLDDTRKEHIVWSKTLPMNTNSTTKYYTINFDNSPTKEVVIKFSNFTPMINAGPNALICELGNIMINFNSAILSF